jgi:hypothetical protein
MVSYFEQKKKKRMLLQRFTCSLGLFNYRSLWERIREIVSYSIYKYKYLPCNDQIYKA